MPIGLVSPGTKVREVDLTQGRIDNVSATTGAIVAPFFKGPVEEPVLIENEQQLLDTFGRPSENDEHYEYWLSATNYLSYGGILRVVRVNGTNLNNANAGVSLASVTLKIKNYEEYQNNYTSGTSWYWAARNPGTWANDVKVCVIDGFADQIITGINTSLTSSSVSSSTVTGIATVPGEFNEAYDTSITGITTTGIQVGDVVSGDYVTTGSTVYAIGVGTIFLSTPSSFDGSVGVATTSLTFTRTTTTTTTATFPRVAVGMGVTQAVSGVLAGAGTTTLLDGYLKGVVTGVGNTLQVNSTGVGTDTITVKITSHVSAAGVETPVTYTQAGVYSFSAGSIGLGTHTQTSAGVLDWYNEQTLGLENSTVYWKEVAERPRTSNFATARNSKNDEIHVVVVDDKGTVSGNPGTILEKFVGLSKAKDATSTNAGPIYYKDFVADNSQYIFAGVRETGKATGFSAGVTTVTDAAGAWGLNSQGVTFHAVGRKTYSLTGGNAYGSADSANPRLTTTLGDLVSGYELFQNKREYPINYLIMGPGFGTKEQTQAKANKLIAIADLRKDCIAVISPNRTSVLTNPGSEGQNPVPISNSTTQTNNVVSFFDGVSSSSYAVFDSGYKYQFDRFSNKFRYVPLNADIAGCMVRTEINDFSWFSPAGTRRGVINNAVKLAYNPSQTERDLLYPRRINPVIYSAGSGIILFGDRTGLAVQSAFDRINVRKLFITIEDTIERASRASLFEFNDAVTRTNFVNIVEPYLRDVQAKRGIQDFVVICDETNNTPDVIDANEFRADIYVKPARSINFIGLTFIATRTGISFEEVIGRV
jgi:hypothetical protein